MEKEILTGLDESTAETEKDKPEMKKSNFAIWKVGNESYKLKLRAQEINELERLYKKNLLMLLDGDEIPALSTQLTIIQAAMKRWNHNITFKKVQDLYDKWVDEGHVQTDLLTEVTLKIYEVSGFFTKEMSEMINESLESEN